MRISPLVALVLALPALARGTLSGPKPPPPVTRQRVPLRDTGGREHAFPDRKAPATVLLFIGHECPISNAYAPEIGRIMRGYRKKGAAFFLVYVDPDLTAAAAKEHTRKFGLPGPAFLDGDHRLVALTGVTVTPEAAVLGPDGQLLYRGRIDDLYVDLGKTRPAPTSRDLRAALDAILAGKPVPVARTRAVGCLIPAKK